MEFTWKRLGEQIKPVAVFLAAIFGWFGVAPKLIFLGIIIWQILTRGATLWGALISFFTTVYKWVKSVFVKK